VSGSEDGKLFWWSLEEGKLVHSSQAHKDNIGSLDYHPEKPYLVTASADKIIKLWTNKQ